jgi:integrase
MFALCVTKRRNIWKVMVCEIKAKRSPITRLSMFSVFSVGRMLVDVDEAAVRQYQDARLKEKAAPKTINEEVGFLPCLLQERGELIRAHLKHQKRLKLKVHNNIAKVYTPEEKTGLVGEAQRSRSRNIYPALMLAQNTGMRSSEIRRVQWKQVDLKKKFLVVAKSKTEAGEAGTSRSRC